MTRDVDADSREFRIRVEGRLSGRFADGLAGVDQRDEAGGTVLCGDFVDDAHLQGVLDELRGLGITVRGFEVAEKHCGEDERVTDEHATRLE